MRAARTGRAQALPLAAPLVFVLGILLAACGRAAPALATRVLAGAPPVTMRPLGPWLGAAGRAMGRLEIELENPSVEDHTGVLSVSGDSWDMSYSRDIPWRLGAGETQRLVVRVPAYASRDGDMTLQLQVDGSDAYDHQTVAALGYVRGAARRVLVVEEGRRDPGWEVARGSDLDQAAIALLPARFTEVLEGVGYGGGVHHAQVMAGAAASGPSHGGSLGHGPGLPGVTAIPAGSAVAPQTGVGRIAPELLAADADALQGYDSVVVDLGGPAPASDAIAALGTYARRGGLLTLANLDGARWRPDWLELTQDERFAFAPAALASDVRRYGHGLVVLGKGAPLEGADQVATLATLLSETAALTPPSEDTRFTVRASRYPSWQTGSGFATDPRLLCLVVIGLVVLLGPVVLRRVKRRGRPALLLVAVPAVSLLATLGVLGYGLVKDGVGLELDLRQYVVLDQRTQTATTHESRAYFAGPLTKGELRPGAGTLVMPTPAEDPYRRNERLRVRVDEDPGLVLGGDLLPMRIERRLAVQTDRSTRLRLEVDFTGPRPRVANALGAEIERLVVLDDEGRRWVADAALQPGAGAELVAEPRASGSMDAARQLETQLDFTPALLEMPRGSYLAQLAESFAYDDLGHPNADVESARALVLGVLDSSAGRTR